MSDLNENESPAGGQAPKYRLTERAYLKADGDHFESLHEEGEEIEYRGVPGYHMEPINAAAKRMVEKHKPVRFDFNKLAPLQAAA